MADVSTREEQCGIHTVLLHVAAGAAGERLARAGIALSARWRAQLIGVSAALPHRPRDTYSGLVLTSVQPGETDLVARRLLATRDLFLKNAAEQGVKAEWHSAVNFPAWALCDAATAADIVVVGRAECDEEGLYQTIVVGDLLMGAGRPVLLLPAQIETPSLDTLLVAWKSGREGRRMLADCLPIMQQAKRVRLVHVPEPLADPGTLDEAQRYLLERGVHTETQIGKDGGSVADILMREAAEMNAGAILAGAYGHSRLREWCFGGVTRALATRSPLPCILCH